MAEVALTGLAFGAHIALPSAKTAKDAMADLSAIGAAAGSLKAAGEIAKALVGLKISTEVQGKVVELQTVILAAQSDAMTAQSAQFELVERVHELEAELARMEDWETEKQRYELKAIDPGAFAYVPKEGMEAGEPPHWLCAKCFEARHKSYLQNVGRVHTEPPKRPTHCKWLCHKCGGYIAVWYSRTPENPERPNAS